ncbi:MAG: glycosyltransferase family 4 protein [Acidimicrobiales bacterium]|nr:glycosyltransferase family 4 protein [Acidimicrobiales bacterium]
MKNVVMVSMSPLKFDSRIDREASALVAAGYQVFVLGLGPVPEDIPWKAIEVGADSGDRKKRSSTYWKLLKYLLLVPYRFRKRKNFVRLVREKLEKFDVIDILHAHDLPALEAVKPFLESYSVVYDSHELWTGRKLYGFGSRFESFRDKRIEVTSVRSVSAVITVSDQMAEELGRRFGRQVDVVRNTFPISNHKPPEGVNFLAYAGNISVGRDLSTVIEGAAKAGIELRIMGRNVSDYELVSPVMTLDHGTVEEAGNFLREAGIAVVSLESGIENHLRALPNKLLQAVAEGVPVIASDLPGIAEIVQSGNLGVLYKPGDSDSFAEAAERVSESYTSFVENTIRAREEFCWSVDSKRLESIYEKVCSALKNTVCS